MTRPHTCPAWKRRATTSRSANRSTGACAPETPANRSTCIATHPGHPEIRKLLLFRDHLRRNARDRRRYEAAKRELATRQWQDMNYYAAAKGPVITEILRTAGWTAPPNDPAELHRPGAS